MRFRGSKNSRAQFLRADRAVAATVIVSVGFILILIGFSGPNEKLCVPKAEGWAYIGLIFALATGFLARIFRPNFTAPRHRKSAYKRRGQRPLGNSASAIPRMTGSR
jgi:multisubunit Na+/H+ antiporter MnhB subunit